jgi:ribosome biogenesis GTPase
MLASVGLDARWEAAAREAGAALDRLARVTSEQRGQWEVATQAGPALAVLAGRWQRAMAGGGEDRPAVGDWVVLREPAGDSRVIEAVLPRRTKLARKAAGRVAREQVVAANVDVVFVVAALGRDVNERRIERFTAIAWNGGATPELVLTKADLVPDPAPYVARAMRAAPGVAVHVVSVVTGAGLDALALVPGRTVALLGTSGAGKSTLVNRWLGRHLLETAAVRGDGKGRHTTTSRHLVPLPSGAVVIDTPGLREVGLWTGDDGLAQTFEDVSAVAVACRFSDCHHQAEPQCAVRAAVTAGVLDPVRVEAWRSLTREQEHIDRQADPALTQEARAGARRGAKALRKRLREKGRG